MAFFNINRVETGNRIVKRRKAMGLSRDGLADLLWGIGVEVSITSIGKASTDHWYDVAIGTSAAHLGITLVNKENCIGIELYISDDKSIFDRLYAEKDVIEKELGLTLDWQRLDGKKASRIVYRIPGLDFDDHSNYDTLMNEAIDKIIAFSKVFKKYMK